MAEPKPGTGDRAAGDPRVRTVRNVAGFALLFFALAGLLLPILQGVLMVLVGVLLIDLPIKRRLHDRLLGYGWYRKLAQWYDAALQPWRGSSGSGDGGGDDPGGDDPGDGSGRGSGSDSGSGSGRGSGGSGGGRRRRRAGGAG